MKMNDIAIDKDLLNRTIKRLEKYSALPYEEDGIDTLLGLMGDTDCLIEELVEALEESEGGENE